MKYIIQIIIYPILAWFFFYWVSGMGRLFIYYPDGKSLTVYDGKLFDGTYYFSFNSNESNDFVTPPIDDDAWRGSEPIYVAESHDNKCKFIVPKEYLKTAHQNKHNTFCFEERLDYKNCLKVLATGPIDLNMSSQAELNKIKLVDIGHALTVYKSPMGSMLLLFYLLAWIAFSILLLIVYFIFIKYKNLKYDK